jgi:hypothetical protein
LREKPVALDLATLDDVLEHVGRAGIFVQIGFQRRFDAGYRAARDAVATGALGNLLVLRAATHDPVPPPETYIATSGGNGPSGASSQPSSKAYAAAARAPARFTTRGPHCSSRSPPTARVRSGGRSRSRRWLAQTLSLVENRQTRLAPDKGDGTR